MGADPIEDFIWIRMPPNQIFSNPFLACSSSSFFSLAVNLAFFGSIVYLIYFLLTLPMRRKERARLFLDLLETRL